MAVRVFLTDCNGALIVERVVDTASGLYRCTHLSSSLGIVNIFDWTKEGSSFGIQGNHNKCRIPVVHGEHMLLSAIDGEVACRCTSSVDGFAELLQATIGADFVSENLSVVLAVLSAGVDDIQAGVIAREGRVHYSFGVTLYVEQNQRSIGRVETVHINGILGLSSPWTVCCYNV